MLTLAGITSMRIFYVSPWRLNINLLIALVFISFAEKQAYASNGLNQIGFGAESIGMAGADVAVARDTSALNINPAGLVQIESNLLDLNLALAYSGDIKHKDQFGNDVSNSNDFPVIGSAGYANKLSNKPLTVGIGIFVQGGTGADYKNINTVFGTTDDLSVLFGVLRITPGVAWQVSDSLSLGISLVGTYASLDQNVFFNTSSNNTVNPAQSFFGFKLTDMEDFNVGAKIGAMYRVNEKTKLGIVYTSKVKLELEGKMTVNYSDLGLGNVTYQNAVAKNLDQPEEFGIGVAYQASDDTLISIELNWINWSDAVTTGVLEASNPDNNLAPPTILFLTNNDWRDQYVFSFGTAYQWSEETLLRAGYNYGRNPIPNQNLNPLLNTIAEHHLTLGYGRTISKMWHVDGAFEWDIRNEETYTNPNSLFGQDSVESGAIYAFYLTLGRKW